MPSFNQLQPYFTAAGAIVSVTTLGFVLNLAKLASDAAKARTEVLEERIRAGKDDTERTEKWSAREKAELQNEVERLRQTLKDAGVTTTLEAREAAPNLTEELKQVIDSRLEELRSLLVKESSVKEPIDSGAALELGRGYMAISQYDFASEYLKKYLLFHPEDWEAQFTRGVALVNLRGGRSTDLAALRSYNEALAFGMEPESGLQLQNRGRLFIYRGAVLKRLGRLNEAEKDIHLGRETATDPYEQADAAYNLACVYALQQDDERLLYELQQARNLERHRYVYNCIKGHMNDYFAAYSLNEAFIDALSQLL